MAEFRRTVGPAGTRPSSQLLRSVHEGWAYHFTPQARSWVKRWLILDGSRLVVFSSERGNSQAVIVSLNLGQGTKVKDVSLQPHVHGLEIELTTMKGVRESRTDFFAFSTPNECDLWKAYILGFSYGIVPENLNLLPGQLKDVREALLDVGPAPPPLPSPNPKRPTLRNVPGFIANQRPGQGINISSSSPASPPDVTSPYSDINESKIERHLIKSSTAGEVVFQNKSETEVLDQLERRRAELAMMALDKEERQPPNHIHHVIERRATHNPAGSFAKMQQLPSWSQYPAPASSPAPLSPPQMAATQRIPSHKARAPIIMANNNELVPFYDDPEKNKVPPTWFLQCSREVAEMVLTAARHHGNMLMRPSFNTNPTETYVISMRRDLPCGLELRHYAVYRTTGGFKLDVIDKHSPMSCLSDVMTFFVNFVGPSAQPINSQTIEKIISGMTSPTGLVLSPKRISSSSLSQDDASHNNETSILNNEIKSETGAAFSTEKSDEVVTAENNINAKDFERVVLNDTNALSPSPTPSSSSLNAQRPEPVSLNLNNTSVNESSAELDESKGSSAEKSGTSISSTSNC